MAYDEYLADRVRQVFNEKHVGFDEKRMMGVLSFMVDEKMCCAIHYDKNKEIDLLMARIGEKAYPKAITKIGCHPMDFTGRSMKGFVFVDANGFDDDDDLEYWIQLSLDFNPFAKASKKRKKRSFDLNPDTLGSDQD